MVAATYESAMVRVFADEGGYTNDPKDPGGPTNWGITIFDARKYWKADAEAIDVKNMPRLVAAGIYRRHYAEPIRYDDLPAGMDYSVLDAAINSGQGRAIPWAGKASGKPVKTATEAVAVSNAAPDKVALIQTYWNARLSFLQGLSTWSHFGRGWGRRCANGEAAAVRMWLAFGAKLSSMEARARMGQESEKATKTSTRIKTGAAGTAAGSAAGSQAFDLSSMGMKIALGIGVVLIVIFIVALLRKAAFHTDRATAYANG
jgi:lysozyme family protein